MTAKSEVPRLLPVYCKVSTALNREASYGGQLPLQRMPRLREALAIGDDTDGAIAVALELGRDDRRRPRLQGRVCGELPLVCQRCLRPFAWPLDAAIDLRLVFSEDEENRALADAEPLLIDGDEIRFHEVVEEEVLLALPIAPRCADPDCRPE